MTRSQATTPGPDTARHLRECGACRMLHGEAGEVAPVSETVRERLRGAVTGDLRPVTPVRSPRQMRLGLLAALGAFAAAWAWWVALYGWLALDGVQRLLMGSAVALGAFVLGGVLVRLTVPGSRHRVRPGTLLAGVLAMLLMAAGLGFPWEGQIEAASDLGCLGHGVVVAVGAAAVTGAMMQRGVVLSPPLTGAVVGGLAGIVGLAVLTLHCPYLEAGHVLRGHVGVAVVMGLAGAGVGWGVGQWRG